MKTMTVALVALLTALGTTGFNCINDSFQVSVNLPLVLEYNVNPGPTGPQAGQQEVRLRDQMDASYLGKIKNTRIYDIRVTTVGTYSGSVSNGVVRIDGTSLLTFAGSWAQFNTPQSILGASTLVQPQTGGITVLLARLNEFKTNENVQVTLSGTCSLSDPSNTVPADLKLRVEILTQADAEIGGDED